MEIRIRLLIRVSKQGSHICQYQINRIMKKTEIKAMLSLLLLFCFLTPPHAQGRGDYPKKGTLKVGDPAPDFNLNRLHENGKGMDKKKVKLSSFKYKNPVVLIFGSYT